ncbi:MAG: AMP-binding protein, partial [Crocinitomicaceae bacterium]|nr:AMP-binding protein [Crocinitomicaceae bacterium]
MALRITSYEQYQKEYQKSIDNPTQFWEEIADTFTWKKKWNNVLDWDFTTPDVKWFEGGSLNITENMLDRHLAENGDKVAFHWEPNDPDAQDKSITYNELHVEVCKMANALKSLGVEKGDRICIYMPMTLEGVVSIIACARIGAVHSIVFAGFSPTALSDRINDAQAKVVITADGLNRGTKQVELKGMVDIALETCTSVESVIVLNCIDCGSNMQEARDLDYHCLIADMPEQCEATEMQSE